MCRIASTRYRRCGRMGFAVRMSRRRGDQSGTMHLLSLPDEILTKILRFLCGTYEWSTLKGRALVSAKSSFALACCNRRLMHLFRHSCLQSISCEGCALPNLFVGSTTRHGRALHVATMAWLAGDTLKSLRLPIVVGYDVETVLHTVAHCCPNLEHLSLPAQSAGLAICIKEVLRSAKNLSELELNKASSGLLKRLLPSAPSTPQTLILSGIQADAKSNLAYWLTRPKYAANLRSLHITFGEGPCLPQWQLNVDRIMRTCVNIHSLVVQPAHISLTPGIARRRVLTRLTLVGETNAPVEEDLIQYCTPDAEVARVPYDELHESESVTVLDPEEPCPPSLRNTKVVRVPWAVDAKKLAIILQLLSLSAPNVERVLVDLCEPVEQAASSRAMVREAYKQLDALERSSVLFDAYPLRVQLARCMDKSF